MDLLVVLVVLLLLFGGGGGCIGAWDRVGESVRSD